VQLRYNQGPQYNTLCGDNQGNIGRFRGGGRGGRGFGGGRGPIVCHNFQKPRHYARDYPQPPVTYMYCRIDDHETRYCLTLLTKIQYKRNQKNHNFQWIVVENREEDGKKIKILTRGGANTREDEKKKDHD
jgi:hypothetical protein